MTLDRSYNGENTQRKGRGGEEEEGEEGKKGEEREGKKGGGRENLEDKLKRGNKKCCLPKGSSMTTSKALVQET